jgi:hypothetical protein
MLVSVAFRWLLNSEEYVPHAELATVRDHVVLASARLIGVMSRVRLSSITDQFTSKLEEKLNPKKDASSRIDVNVSRAQILKLCQGKVGLQPSATFILLVFASD